MQVNSTRCLLRNWQASDTFRCVFEVRKLVRIVGLLEVKSKVGPLPEAPGVPVAPSATRKSPLAGRHRIYFAIISGLSDNWQGKRN